MSDLLEKSITLTQKLYNSTDKPYEIENQLESDLFKIYYHPDAHLFPPNNDYEIMLPYSGGVDSFIGYYFAKARFKKVRPIFVDYGQPYTAEEVKSVNGTNFEDEIEMIDLTSKLQFDKQDVWGEHFPSRNWLFCVLAAERIEKMGSIWICAHDGEITNLWGDKSLYFLEKGSDILSSHFNKPIRIEFPFQNRTKAEMISWYLNEGLDKQAMVERVTCHNFIDGEPCGECLGCCPRYVSMKMNGINEHYVYDVHENAKTYFRNSLQGPLNIFSRKRLEEAETVLGKF